MSRQTFSLDLTVRAPVMCQGLAPSALGVDASFIRDEKGRPILPADHVKGLLRASVAYLDGNAARRLFGPEPKPSGDLRLGASNEPMRGRVFLSDLAATSYTPALIGSGSRTTHRVEIGPDGAANPGSLQEIELIAPAGTEITFAGTLTLHATAEDDVAVLKSALERISQVGAFKSVGFGEVVRRTLSPLDTPSHHEIADADRVTVEIRFDRPIMVDAQRVADNLFRSSVILPGAALKGSLAEALKRADRLTEAVGIALGKVRIGHGFPLDRDGEPMMRTPPRSLAAHEGRLICALGLEPDEVPLIDGMAAAFVNDWKPAQLESVRKALGWSTDRLHAAIQRTRVAVGLDSVAEDEMLFAYQAVPSMWPGEDANGFEPRLWRFELAQNGADPVSWGVILQTLGEGLDGVGKTDARAVVIHSSESDVQRLPDPLDIGAGRKAWAVTLTTSALMIDPDDPWHAATQYANYWSWALERLGHKGQVTLLDWFTDERLHGGHEAMRRGLFGAGRYQPLVITQPGSVFLIEAADGVETALTKALQTGLPPRPPKLSQKHDLDWRDTTFVAENGYGEIALHHDAHVRLKPGAARV